MKTEDLKELIKRAGWEISALGYIHAGTNAVTFNELQRIVDEVETRAMRQMMKWTEVGVGIYPSTSDQHR